MKRKFYLIFVLCLGIILLSSFIVGGCGKTTTTPETSASPTAPSESVTLRLSSSLPPEDIVVVKLQEMADRISERTDGKFVIEVYAGGTLSSMEETFGMLNLHFKPY